MTWQTFDGEAPAVQVLCTDWRPWSTTEGGRTVNGWIMASPARYLSPRARLRYATESVATYMVATRRAPTSSITPPLARLTWAQAVDVAQMKGIELVTDSMLEDVRRWGSAVDVPLDRRPLLQALPKLSREWDLALDQALEEDAHRQGWSILGSLLYPTPPAPVAGPWLEWTRSNGPSAPLGHLVRFFCRAARPPEG
jgi:hypothetical protein